MTAAAAPWRDLGSDGPGVRADRRQARARAEHRRAGDVQPDVERALRVQALQEAAAPAAGRGSQARHGAGGERRRGGRRQRHVVRVQGRVAQPPERGGALPGRGDRRRRDPARRLRRRRAADRDPRLPALRRARLAALALPARARRRRHRPLRQLDRRGDRRRRDLLRGPLRAQLPRQRDVPRPDRDGAADPLGRRRRRQPARLVRRAHRPRRHRRRVRSRERGARRGGRREAADGPDRRPVRGEEAARVLAGAARARPARLAAGPRRGWSDFERLRDGLQGRGRHRHRRRSRSAARGRHGAVRDHGLRVAGAHAVRRRARARRRGARRVPRSGRSTARSSAR